MNDIKVSIIVPIYNSEHYLEKCLDSLVNQTLSNIEIILIDDCSTDSSGEICNRYFEKYENIVFIKKDVNKGPSQSRNKAIEMSKGKYIGFVDSDDWISFDMYEKLYNHSISTKSDMVMCKITEIYANNREKTIGIDESFTLEDKDEIISKFMKFDILAYSCNKLFKSELIKNNNIKFPDLRFGEDQYTTFMTLYKSNRISFIDESLYFYNKRCNSATTNKFSLIRLDILKSMDMIRNVMIEDNVYYRYKDLYQFRYMFVVFGNIVDVCIKEFNLTEIKNIYLKIKDNFKYNMRGYNLNKTIGIKNKIRIFIFKNSIYIYSLLYKTIFRNKI